MPQLIRATSTTLRVVIIEAFVLAIVFIGAGIWLVYLGATGDTKFAFFGQTFSSTNVGIATLFLGTAKRRKTWRLRQMNGRKIPRFWTEDSRD